MPNLTDKPLNHTPAAAAALLSWVHILSWNIHFLKMIYRLGLQVIRQAFRLPRLTLRPVGRLTNILHNQWAIADESALSLLAVR